MIILYVIIGVISVCLLSSVNYSVYSCFKDGALTYHFKTALLFGFVILEGNGAGADVQIKINVLFLKKTFHLSSGEQKNKKVKKSDSMHILDILEQIYKYKKYINDFLYRIKPHYFKIEGCCGFSDPSVTGIFTGYIYMIRPVFKNIIIDVNPDFLKESVDIKMKVEGTVRPILLMRSILKLTSLILKLRKKSLHGLRRRKQKFKTSET